MFKFREYVKCVCFLQFMTKTVKLAFTGTALVWCLYVLLTFVSYSSEKKCQWWQNKCDRVEQEVTRFSVLQFSSVWLRLKFVCVYKVLLWKEIHIWLIYNMVLHEVHIILWCSPIHVLRLFTKLRYILVKDYYVVILTYTDCTLFVSRHIEILRLAMRKVCTKMP